MHAFSPEIFARRRDEVVSRLGNAAMVLPAAPVRYHTHDVGYRYRPDSELFYLTGFTEPGAVAVLRGQAEEDRFVLFVRERDEKAERWDGPRVGPDGAIEELGADDAYPRGELEERLPDLLKGSAGVYYRLGVDRTVQAPVEAALEHARARGARKGVGPRKVVDPGEILDDLRLVKDPEEIARIRRAAEITMEGFRSAARAMGPGAGEWEVEAALEATFRRQGALGPAFASIVASGPNACVLHYAANDRRIADGDLVLVDAGAEVDFYAGDVTRTLPASGRFTPEQRSVYEVVNEARRAAVDAARPGATTEELHTAALEVLVEGLIELGVLEGPAEERLEDESHKELFPHQTSHWLGLDTHDPGDYARAGEPRTLEPGMVLTVEPGLYFRKECELEGAEPYLGIGIRIEDDVLVTDEGREVLTAALPTDPDEVAELAGEA